MAHPTTPTTTITLAVEGMTCGSCVRHIGEALNRSFTGLEHQIDLPGGTMTVTFDADRIALADIADVMRDEGYPVHPLA